MAIGSILGAIGSMAGGIMGNKKGADAEEEAAQIRRAGVTKTMGIQNEMYGKMRGLQQPYMQAGGQAVQPLMSLMMGQRGVMDNQLAQAQQSSGLDMLRQRFGGNLSSGVEQGFSGRLGSMEQSGQRDRLGRMIDIGMGGASGLAGTGNTRANALSNALSQSSAISNQAQQNISNSNQQMFNNTAYSMGQIPSSIAMNNYMQGQQQTFGGGY